MIQTVFPGASREEWAHFSQALGLTAHLLPVVSDVTAQIAPDSTLKAIGKVPSRYNQARQAVGIAKWTELQSTAPQIAMWSQERNYGISIQARAIRAIDVDLEESSSVQAVLSCVVSEIGSLPQRRREGSNRVLLAFRYAGALTKRVIKRGVGIIELLADGQQFVAAGAHPKGGRYYWDGGLPTEFPLITAEELESLWAALGGEPAKAARQPAEFALQGQDDPCLAWLAEHGWVLGERQGVYQVTCPWKGEHTADSGPTECCYWPAGTGGYERGHFKCLHAHCDHRTDADFLDAVGYRFADLADFEAVSTPEKTVTAGTSLDALKADRSPAVTVVLEESPTGSWRSSTPGEGLTRGRKGFEATLKNVCRALDTPKFWRRLGYDRFRMELMSSPWGQEQESATWTPLTDLDLVQARELFDHSGFVPVGREMMRDAAEKVAHARSFDALQLWVGRLSWDGQKRVDTFLADHYGVSDTPYSRAVGAYWWTALAGRALDPGCQADMVPILAGPQGLRKTRGIESLAPWPEAYTTVNLSGQDDNLARCMRGACVLEINELRGLHTRESGAIKSFITQRTDKWIPKFKEFATWSARRGIFVGTANEIDVLDDETGNRRWLPVRVTRFGELTEAVKCQLWAEGVARYLADGIAWQEAEALGAGEHEGFRIADVWEDELTAWLAKRTSHGEEVGGFTNGSGAGNGELISFSLHEAALGIGLDPRQMKRTEEVRLGRSLRALGWEKRQVWAGEKNVKRWVWRDS